MNLLPKSVTTTEPNWPEVIRLDLVLNWLISAVLGPSLDHGTPEIEETVIR